MLKQTASLAALAAAAALAIPVAGWADDGTPPQQPSGGRAARILERISRIEARLATWQQKIADHCSAAQPTPTAGGDQQGTSTAPSRADRCARAQERLQKAQDRLEKLKQRIQQWLQKHNGQDGGNGSGLSASDQQALAGLQQQLAGLQG